MLTGGTISLNRSSYAYYCTIQPLLIVTGQLSLFPLCNILLSLRGSREVSCREENALHVNMSLLRRLSRISSSKIISITIIIHVICFAEKVFEIFLMTKLEKPIERAKNDQLESMLDR